jgi:hypothetical protein
VIGADDRTPIPIPRRIDPCAGRRAPRRPGWRRAPGSGTAAAGRRPDGCPCTGGARREEEAQPEAAEEAAMATALRTRTVRFRLEQYRHREGALPLPLTWLCADDFLQADGVLGRESRLEFVSSCVRSTQTVSVSEHFWNFKTYYIIASYCDPRPQAQATLI